MRTFVKLIGNIRAQKIAVKLLRTIIQVHREFQNGVEGIKGVHSFYYEKSKIKCENLKEAIEIIDKSPSKS